MHQIEYIVDGSVDTFLVIPKEMPILLNLDNKMALKFPVVGKMPLLLHTNGYRQSFEIYLKSDGYETVWKTTDQYLKPIFNWIAYYFDVAITRVVVTAIKEVETGQGPYYPDRDHSYPPFRHFDTSPQISNELSAQFNKKISPISNGKEKTRLLLSLYNDALFSNDKTKNFWNMYAIMILIIGDSRSSERIAIDNLIKSLKPNIELYKDHKGKEVTIITAIRDSYNHNTRYHEQGFHFEKAIYSNIGTFSLIVRKAINLKTIKL